MVGNSKHSKASVLLILRASIEQYPPTLNQANMLAESGLQVNVIDLAGKQAFAGLHGSVVRSSLYRAWDPRTEPPQPVWYRSYNYLRFQMACNAAIANFKPRIVIAYDTLAAGFVKPRRRFYETIYHFHELSLREAGESFGPRRARLTALRRSRHASLVIHADGDRARRYREMARLWVPPRVVMNCTRRLLHVPVPTLRGEVAASGSQPIVAYLGSIGQDQGVVEAAQSMRHWPANSLFVLVGSGPDEIKRRILQAAADCGAGDRVRFLGPKPQPKAFSLIAGADLGLSLIQPNTPNWLYSSGAINKRFEYMALGVPQVTNDGPGVSNLIEKNNCGVCVNPRDPDAIGLAVARLLNRPEQIREMSVSARLRHLGEFNYETQFAPILEWIHQRCAAVRIKRT